MIALRGCLIQSAKHVYDRSGERLETLDIETPAFVDESGQRFSFDDMRVKHSLTYFADRTLYRASFDHALQVSLTVYAAYGKPVGVL
ncbi:MAG: hypothetical protein JO108_36755 [Acidobacteriaceae bacterium]|nr:hypothetical protein [Acidobacteriaceae bacterium]